jgi:hypothetical protein
MEDLCHVAGGPPPTPRLPLRGVSEKGQANDVVERPAKKLTAGVESGASVRVLKA